MFQTYDQAVTNEARKIMTEQVEFLSEQIIKGQVADIAEYKWLSGQIAGLKFALASFEAADENLQRGENR
jgi:hypothetical protein